jgi:hypothetical protein
MLRRAVRVGLIVAGVLLTAGLGYRAVADEASLGREQRERAGHDQAAAHALDALHDLRATLHAYVAPGQGLPFWSRRADQTADALRQHLVTLDAALAPQGGSLTDALDAVDQLAAAERRARDYVRRGDPLLAADVIFIEVRDLMVATMEQVHTARTTLAAAHDRRRSALRREQAVLAGAGMVVWVIIAFLLAPQPKAPAVEDPNEWRHELAETIKNPVPKALGEAARTEPVAPVEPVESVEPGLPLRVVREAGEVCADMSALSDIGALAGTLDRAAAVLDAGGVIVWLAANDGGSLTPVASHGFDRKLVARIGRIQRDSANLTAAAFRDNVPRVSAASDATPAALAVALCGPSGPAGVLSVELKPGVPADERRVALATIFAAQLATLAAPLPSASPAAPETPEAPAAKVEEPKSAAL